ncbi:uncharacterized protein LOC112056411 [Bicyclus anynana]|uniref:Uncharacterized protein LOC112056411 n=1 Tax=Bicyclus anynana TaxID=110368 RepID=A0A6J1P4G8_BICAN|nr:uncharacterized protein LOC112056411 [Bicyclus anynana]
MKFLVFAALVAMATANPLNTWSVADLTAAVNDPRTDANFLPYLQHALNELLNAIAGGHEVDAIVVPTPTVLEVASQPTTWTLPELSAALQNSHTDPEIRPLLVDALNNLMSAIHSGDNVNSIVVNMPVEEVVEPEKPVPEPPTPLPQPPVTSPLVQVIVNVNGQQTHFTEVPAFDDIPQDVLASLR